MASFPEKENPQRRELLEAWNYQPKVLPDQTFESLETGALFRLQTIDYRKIPPIEIPDLGERNASTVEGAGWRYFEPSRVVDQWGTTELEIDRVRAARAEGRDLRTFLTALKLQTLPLRFKSLFNSF